MRLQELKQKEQFEIDEVKGKAVTFFLQSFFHKLKGSWYWDMEAKAVFCSDVMLSLPVDFIGTKGIFHPDDLEGVKKRLAAASDARIESLEFRIITSYGEVKNLVGRHLAIEKAEDGMDRWPEQLAEETIRESENKSKRQHLQLLYQVYLNTEHFTGAGVWYHNTATSETGYSDYLFRLHGLPPQSLNAHLHTFHSFIHPEDITLVTEFTDKAYAEKLPLHFTYRIVTGDGEKTVDYKSQWFLSEKGESILCGTIQDISEQKAGEEETAAYKDLAQFQKGQLAFGEQHAGVGYWQVDLLTRKTVYSDNYYRIFGLKPATLVANIHSFINFIHPDDQDAVIAAYKKLIYEHAVPDIEYRIVRPDGKTRYISQKAKMMMYEKDMVVSGIIQDITVQRLLEKKVAELNEQKLQKGLEQLQSQEMGSTGSWVMDAETETITWSDNVYKLLGYKTAITAMTAKAFHSFIHPHDLKTFKDNWNRVLKEKQEAAFPFRFLLRGAERHMKAIFRLHSSKEKEFFIGTVQDITLENVLQQQLANRVQLAESLTENILDRVMITDVNHTVLLWNRACETAYGVKKEVALGQNFFDLFPQLKTEEEVQLFQKALRGEKVTKEGSASATGNGYYDLNLMPLWNNGEVTGILHIIHDVTRETKLRNSLNDRLHFIESLLESSVDRIVALDRNLNYLYWNTQAEKYYGLSKKKVIGKNVLEIFPQIRNDPSFGEFRQALQGQTVHIPAAGEKEKYFETYLIPVKDEKGEVVSVLWIAHDLTRELHLIQQEQEAQQQLKEEHARLKAAEAEVKESKHLLEKVFDASFTGIAVFSVVRNKEGKICDFEYRLANTVIEQFAGRPVIGEHYLKLFPGVEKSGLADVFRSVIETGVPADFEQYYEGDGFRNWFRITAMKLGDGLVSSVEDITKRKKAEEEMKKNIAILQEAEALAHIGSWDYEIGTGKFQWSEGMYRLFGLPQRMSVSPETYLDFAVEEDRSVARRIIKNLKKDHRSFEEIITIERGEARRQLKVKGTVVQDEKGVPQKVVGVDLDITDIKEAEEKLAEIQHWLEQTAKASPDSITIYDLQKKQPVYLNNCLAEWTGHSLEELVNMGIEGRLQLTHPDDRLPLLHFNEMIALANDGEVKVHEYRLKTKDGAYIWIHNRSKVFQRNEEGKVTHILSVLQDVTEAKKAEEELKQLNLSLDQTNKDLKAKNEEITSFAFVASHDLKEPIRKLYTFTDWLLTREPSVSETGATNLKKMMGSINRLDTLIDDIMALSKAHLTNEKQKQVDLNSLLRTVIEDCSDVVERSGVRIEAEQLPSIKGVETQLFSLFKNLISNAIKFQPKGGIPKISITAKETEKENKKGIAISFTDNGIGFTSNYSKKIFLIFQRLHNRDEYDGTGMGLAICKKIMEKHNGTITAQSEPGKGSTFICWFPV